MIIQDKQPLAWHFKDCTLIRYDIIQGLANLYHATNDQTVKEKAWALIELEEDPKYRKKYTAVWKSR